MVDAERGPARGDRGGHAREVAGHHVGVALDHDHLASAAHVALGEVEPVEHGALVIDGRLGGVEVLRALVVLAQAARAEADGGARQVADGPHQAAAEPVVRAAVALAEEAGGHELGLRVALGREVRGQRVQALRGEADAEALRRALVEAALPEEGAADLRLLGSELHDEELRRGLVRAEEPRAVALVGGGLAVLVVQLVADALRHALHGLRERHMVHALQERVDVAALATAEAVVEADLRPHVEARGALVVERAEALQGSDAGGLEGDVLPHHVAQVDPGADLVDVALADQCHRLILRPASSAGPCPTAISPASISPAGISPAGISPAGIRRRAARTGARTRRWPTGP